MHVVSFVIPVVPLLWNMKHQTFFLMSSALILDDGLCIEVLKVYLSEWLPV